MSISKQLQVSQVTVNSPPLALMPLFKTTFKHQVPFYECVPTGVLETPVELLRTEKFDYLAVSSQLENWIELCRFYAQITPDHMQSIDQLIKAPQRSVAQLHAANTLSQNVLNKCGDILSNATNNAINDYNEILNIHFPKDFNITHSDLDMYSNTMPDLTIATNDKDLVECYAMFSDESSHCLKLVVTPQDCLTTMTFDLDLLPHCLRQIVVDITILFSRFALRQPATNLITNYFYEDDCDLRGNFTKANISRKNCERLHILFHEENISEIHAAFVEMGINDTLFEGKFSHSVIAESFESWEYIKSLEMYELEMEIPEFFNSDYSLIGGEPINLNQAFTHIRNKMLSNKDVLEEKHRTINNTVYALLTTLIDTSFPTLSDFYSVFENNEHAPIEDAQIVNYNVSSSSTEYCCLNELYMNRQNGDEYPMYSTINITEPKKTIAALETYALAESLLLTLSYRISEIENH